MFTPDVASQYAHWLKQPVMEWANRKTTTVEDLSAFVPEDAPARFHAVHASFSPKPIRLIVFQDRDFMLTVLLTSGANMSHLARKIDYSPTMWRCETVQAFYHGPDPPPAEIISEAFHLLIELTEQVSLAQAPVGPAH